MSSFQEKRREPRQAAEGTVLIMTEGPATTTVGALLDTSVHGFRAKHTNGALQTGQEVEFEHSGRRGKAKVVWNRIHSSGVESGFYVAED